MIKLKVIYAFLIVLGLSACLLIPNIIASNNDRDQLTKIVGKDATIKLIDGSWLKTRIYAVDKRLFEVKGVFNITIKEVK